MAYDEWREWTRTRMLREEKLKAVDREIQTYHQLKTRPALEDLSATWEEYKKKKSRADEPDRWKSSRRNRYGTLEKLDKQIARALVNPLSKEEIAWAEIAKANENMVDIIFRQGWSGGCRLALRPLLIESMIKRFHKDVKKHQDNARRATVAGQVRLMAPHASSIHSGLKGTLTIGDTILSFGQAGAQEVKDPGVLQTVASVVADAFGEALQFGLRLIPEVIKDFVAKFTAEVVPWIGVGTSGLNAILSGAQLAYSFNRDRKLIWNRPGNVMLPGAPQAAILAILELMQREKEVYAFDFSRHTATCGGKMAAIAVDGGTAIGPIAGAANAVAGMIMTLYRLGRDLIEVFQANRRLSQAEPITREIFMVNPLMAAYFILEAPTSALIPFFGDVARSEKARKRIEPLMQMSSDFLSSSRYELVNADGSPTVAHKSHVIWTTAKRKNLQSKVAFGKLTQLSRMLNRNKSNVVHVDDNSAIEAYATAWNVDVTTALAAKERARTHIGSHIEAFETHETINPLVAHEAEIRAAETDCKAPRPQRNKDDIPMTDNPMRRTLKTTRV